MSDRGEDRGPAGPALRLALIAHRVQRNDGQGRVNYELARAALRRGMQVTLLAAHCAEDLAAHPQVQFVRLGRESRPTQFWRNLAFADDATKWLRRNRASVDVVQANGFITWEPCDVVAMHFVHTAWLGSRFYPFRGSMKPYAMYQRTFTLLNSRWEKRAVRTAKRVVAVSGRMAREVASLGVAAQRIRTVPNGVDVEEFSPGPAERESFKLPEGVPLVLFAGDIRSPRKNLLTVLRALQKLPGVHLAVAGGVEGSAAPQQTSEMGIAERVHFLGKTARMPALMRSVDAFVFPSLYEPYGLVVAEAMATGVPVVTSREIGCADVFEGALELLDDAEDPAELAGRVDALLQSPERRAAMSRAGRVRALEVSWDKTTAAYLEVIGEVAGFEEARPKS